MTQIACPRISKFSEVIISPALKNEYISDSWTNNVVINNLPNNKELAGLQLHTIIQILLT